MDAAEVVLTGKFTAVNDSIKKERHFSEEDMQMASKPWKDAHHHQSLGKCQSKAQWAISSHPRGWKNFQTVTRVTDDMEKSDAHPLLLRL